MLIASFDGSAVKNEHGHLKAGIGFVIQNNDGCIIRKGAYSIKGNCNNYRAEYEAMLRLSEELKRLQPKGMVVIKGDASFVINHVKKMYANPEEKSNESYWDITKKIVKNLLDIPKFHPYFYWVPRNKNKAADRMSGRASGKYTKLNYTNKGKASNGHRTNKRPHQNNGLRSIIP